MKPDFIDIHAHVNFAAFDADRDAVIKRALDNKTWVMNVGTQQNTAKLAVEMANQYERGVYAIVGLHPVHTSKSYHDEKELGEGGKAFTSRGETFDFEYYKKLAEDPKVVAIGECGLDYFRLDEHSEEIQKKTFIEHIELANSLDKPLMLHVRNGSGRSAYREAVEILKSHAKVKGDFHFFAGSWEEAKEILDLGFTLSFTGVITFAKDYNEVIKNVPLDMIMSETDCPYVTPVPYRGKRNEPTYVSEVVKVIAAIKGEDFEKVRAQIIGNAFGMFNL